MTLSLYFARRFLLNFLAVFGVFLTFMFMVDMVEQLRKFAANDVGVQQAALLAALNVPQNIYRILPLLTILATLALFVAVARSSELVVVRAGGRSALYTLLAPILTALMLGVFAVAVLNPIVAATSRRYEAMADRFSGSDASILSIDQEGLWLRQSGADRQTVIRALRANLDGTQLFNVTFLEFGQDGGIMRRIEAATALLAPGAWHLDQVKIWRFIPGTNPEADAQFQASLSLPSDLTVDQIRESFGTPSAISIWNLPKFIDQLSRSGFSARQYRMWFQRELALPAMMAAMVLVGAAFTMRHARFGKTGVKVLMALLAGFSLFFLRNLSQVLGENGNIPVVLAAWSPPLAATLLALGLLLHLEDG